MYAKPLLLIFLGLALSACARVTVSVIPSPEFTETASPSPSATAPAFTATSLPSSTPLPSATPTQTATIASPSFSQGCDGSAYIRDVTIRDGTKLTPGETFTKTWKLKNTGTCAWSKGYSITFVSGADMYGFDTKINQYVKPGHTAEISVSLTAPDERGTYTSYWILEDKNGTPFGARVYVQIVVSDDAATITPTGTHTSTPAFTPTSLQTSTSIATLSSTSSVTPTITSNPPTSTSVPASATAMSTDTPTSSPTATP
jgi:Ig-like domain from next to BRCA1 gene